MSKTLYELTALEENPAILLLQYTDGFYDMFSYNTIDDAVDHYIIAKMIEYAISALSDSDISDKEIINLLYNHGDVNVYSVMSTYKDRNDESFSSLNKVTLIISGANFYKININKDTVYFTECIAVAKKEFIEITSIAMNEQSDLSIAIKNIVKDFESLMLCIDWS